MRKDREAMMFGGKKQLEREIEELREQNEKSGAVVRELSQVQPDAEKRIEALEALRQQSEKHMEQLSKDLSRAGQAALESGESIEDVHSAMVEMNYGVKSFEENHYAFLERLKNQNEKFSEFLELHRKYLEPLEKLCEVQEQMLEADDRTEQTLTEMKDYSKNMSVLALNAAIEAGRMGDEAEDFICAAAKVRACSENFEHSAETLLKELSDSRARVSELEEELQKISRLFKECTIAMGKFYSSSVQEISEYEGEQRKLHEIISLDLSGKTEGVRQSGEELRHVHQEMDSHIQAAREQIEQQAPHTEGLRELCQKLQRLSETLP